MKKNLFALLLIGLVVGHASAADRYWDPDLDNSTNPNDSTTGANLGGVGTWNATSLNWWDGTASPAPDIAWANGNNAIFWGPSGGAVTIPGAASATTGQTPTIWSPSGLVFKTTGYDITATGNSAAATSNGTLIARGRINFTATPSIVVDPNVNATITTILTG